LGFTRITAGLLALGLASLSAAAEAQPAQTEIEWLEQVSEPPKDQRAAAPSAPSSIADGKPLALKLGASIWSRYELRRNYRGLEPTLPDARIRDFDAVAYRARLLLRTAPLSLGKGVGVDLAVVPQGSGFWAPSGDNTDAELRLHEGYFRTLMGSRAYLQLGRFEMSYGDEWLIGANDWHETGRSFDGLRFHLGAEKNAAFVDAFLTLLREGRSNDPATTSDDRVTSGDQMMLGVYGDLGPMISDRLHLDPYAILLMTPRSDRYYAPGATVPVRREAAYEGIVGMRVKGREGVVDYRIEGGVQFGQRAYDATVVDVIAGAVDAEIGFNLPATIRVALEGHFASGDDPTTGKDEGWADRFSQPHKWLGLSDVFQTRTNVTGVGAFLSAAPVSGLDFGVQGHLLFKPRVFVPGTAGTPDDVEAKYAGLEIDPYLGWEFAKGILLRSEYGVFIPSSGAYGDQKAAHYFGLRFGYDNPG
jgi:hypothetical protein